MLSDPSLDCPATAASRQMSGLDCLNSAQKQAVTYTGQHLLVFAGPGTGKTRVITHRIAYLVLNQGLDPESILAITFTNKAAQEMKERLIQLLAGKTPSRPWMGTFHGFSHWFLRRHWKDAGLPKDFVIYDADDQKALMRELLAETEVGASKAGIVLDIIQRLKDDLMDVKSYDIHTNISSNPHRLQIAKFYASYQQALRSRGALDFGDLLMETDALLKGNSEIAKLYQERFPCVFIDEYQDVNHAQYTLAKLLAGETGSLTCVADDDQVIYEWRNANPRYTLEFNKDFKNAGSVVLTENYRSTPNILAAAGRLIIHNQARKDKALCAVRPAGQDPAVIAADDERQEARTISEQVKQMIDNGLAPSEIAVFYRINAQSRNFEIELRAKGVPYRIIGSVGFYARRETKDILALARLLVNPKDSVSFWRVLTNYPAFSLTRTAMAEIKAFAGREGLTPWDALSLTAQGRGPVRLSAKTQNKIRRLTEVYGKLSELVAQKTPLAAILETVATATNYLEGIEEERAWNVWELIESAGEFEKQNPQTDLLGFLNNTSLLSSASADNNRPAQAEAISIMTAHLAKGLEFKAVFLTGLEEGLFPFKISKTDPGELEEERRLFYVAMTRAKDTLTMSYAKRRLIFGSESSGSPSRFLFEAGFIGGQWENRPALRRGCRVKHPLFGEGRIVALSGSGKDTKATVLFAAGGTRKFLTSVAPLTIL